MKEPHAIFLDLDGTLTYRSGNAAPEDARALAQARKNGHQVILNTGRAPGFMPKDVLREIGFDGVIHGSVYVRWHGRQLLRAFLPQDVVRQTVRYFLKLQDWCLYEAEECVFYSHSRGAPDMPLVTSEDDFDTKYAYAHVLKLTSSRDLTPEGEALLAKHFLVIHHPTYTESIIRGYDKATGMELVSQACGIPRERCIAVGDSRNDLDMMRWAGISVAMGNALPEVREFSDHVTKPVWEHGVAAFLEDYGLI